MTRDLTTKHKQLDEINQAFVDVAKAYQGQGERLSLLAKLLQPYMSKVIGNPIQDQCRRVLEAILEVHNVYGERLKVGGLAIGNFVAELATRAMNESTDASNIKDDASADTNRQGH